MSSPTSREVDAAVAVIKGFLQHLQTEFDPVLNRSRVLNLADPEVQRQRDSFFDQSYSAEETLGGLRKWAETLRQTQNLNRSHEVRH